MRVTVPLRLPVAVVTAVVTGIATGVCLLGGPAAAQPTSSTGADSTLDLATTTSVRDSGLLDALLPEFERASGLSVRVIAVGTGAALRMGAEGNADVLLTHAPTAEAELLASGAVEARHPFMENHFVIVGPEEDPAGVADAGDAADAYRRMAAANAGYISRSDDSGTHKREVALMTAAGLDPEIGWPRVSRTGTGMGLSLMVAGERRGYILSDIGTFLAFQKRTDLAVHSRPEPALRNVYSVMPVDPSHFAGREARIDGEGAARLVAFLTSPATQRRIAAFGSERFGRPLFRPLRLDESTE